MMPLPRYLAALLGPALSQLVLTQAEAQSTTAWRDPSPHEVRFVAVDSDVRLEVLAWGGTGGPVVFLDCYVNAHMFDDLAPKLTDQFHVYAITRRGVGASSHPSTGYSPQGRADDILEKWEGDLRGGVPTAKIVEVPGATMYMFLSKEAAVIRELRAFRSSLPAPPR